MCVLAFACAVSESVPRKTDTAVKAVRSLYYGSTRFCDANISFEFLFPKFSVNPLMPGERPLCRIYDRPYFRET